MRLLIITHTLPHDEPGGSQAYVQALASTLRAEHEIVVLTGSAAGSTGLPVRTVRRLPPLAVDAPASVRAWWHLRDQWSLAQHRSVVEELRRFRPDVVHSHQCQGLTSAVFSAIAASDLPHVHTAHDLNLLFMNTRMMRSGRECRGRCAACLLQRSVRGSLIARRLDFLIAPSDHFRRVHVAAGVIAAERAITVPQGAEPGPRRVRGLDDRPLRVGFIGAVAKHKGVPTLLAALDIAQGRWRLEIAGGGPLASIVSAAAARDSRITFTGVVDGKTKDAFFDRIDLLVVPSEGEENAPLVVAEASVRGIPAVVSDRGGLAESPLAAVIPGGDAAALAATLDRFDVDRAEVRSRSRALLANADEYSWGHHVEQVVAVLERARVAPRSAITPLLPARRAVRPASASWSANRS